MHDIIIANMIRAERDRMETGAVPMEETRPIQSFFRKLFTRQSVDSRPATKATSRVGTSPSCQSCACHTAH